VKQVGIQDNFFELGGDSILSIQVIARANQAGLRLTPRQFFQRPTVEGLAAVAGAPEVSQVEQGLIVGSVPLTPIQHWFFEHHPLGPHHWNTSIMLEVWTRLDPAVLKESIKHLLAHHDALRLRFELPDPNTSSSHQDIQQFNAGLDDAVPVSFRDLSAIPPEKHRTAIETSAAQVQASLNLSQGPLFRVTYFDRGPEQSGRLLIVFHHLVTDGVSLRILLEDFQRAYRQISGGESVQFPAKTSSFQTWAKRLVKYAQPEELRQELSYWEQMGQETFPSLPTDYPDGTNTYGQTARVVVSLEASETRALLQAVPAAYGAQIYEALLAGLVESLSRWTGRRAMLVELEGHGREDMFFDEVNVSRTIGWFTSMFPVVLDLESARDPLESLAAIRGQLRAIPNRGIGYGLLRYLCQDEAVRSRMSRLPAPEVNFNYLGQFDQTPIESIPFSIAPESVGPEQHPHGRRSALIYVVGIITGGSLDIQWSYSTGAHRRETIQGMADAYVEELRRLIARCAT
jgi:non-ribosomal peptide synthase protein (TIGR01720 family)